MEAVTLQSDEVQQLPDGPCIREGLTWIDGWEVISIDHVEGRIYLTLQKWGYGDEPDRELITLQEGLRRGVD